MITAVFASHASMSRKSSVSLPATGNFTQVLPPSVVRSTVPFDPLAQQTSADGALTPRSDASVPLSSFRHCAKEQRDTRRNVSRLMDRADFIAPILDQSVRIRENPRFEILRLLLVLSEVYRLSTNDCLYGIACAVVSIRWDRVTW